MKKFFLIIIGIGLGTLHVSAQKVNSVDVVGITVSDMDIALKFYTEVLPFEKVSETEVYGKVYEELKGLFGIRYRRMRLRLGNEQIELTDYLTAGGRSIPEDSRSNDLWFQHIAIVVHDMDSAYNYLRSQKVLQVSTAPQTLPKTIPAAEGIKAFYFRDPDGHNLELIYFPPGKGKSKWQEKTEKLFLGIDHTAIGISSTDQSSDFYQNLLGISYGGESHNFGDEQEHLNNIEGASLHITGNHSDSGPGVEFLEYVKPGPGRPYPKDARADDILHWETVFITNDIEGMFLKLQKGKASFITKSVISLPEYYGYKRGFYVRDPDGHVVGIFANN